MKHTYDNDRIDFKIKIHYEDYHDNIIDNFNEVYGMKLGPGEKKGSQPIKEIKLEAVRWAPSGENWQRLQTCKFEINLDDEFTIEDTIQAYMVKNFSSFDDIHKVYALAFLERYCVDYDEIELNENKTNIVLCKKKNKTYNEK